MTSATLTAKQTEGAAAVIARHLHQRPTVTEQREGGVPFVVIRDERGRLIATKP